VGLRVETVFCIGWEVDSNVSI